MAKGHKVTYSITEITVTTGRTATIEFRVNGKPVTIEVPADLKAFFTEQFSRPNPTANQKRRYATLMRLLEAAYCKGIEDGNRVAA